jgi:hypothetical protein
MAVGDGVERNDKLHNLHTQGTHGLCIIIIKCGFSQVVLLP